MIKEGKTRTAAVVEVVHPAAIYGIMASVSPDAVFQVPRPGIPSRQGSSKRKESAMEGLALVAVMLCILAAAGISRRIQGTIFTLPMVYVVLGFLLSDRCLGIISMGHLEGEILHIIAELTLVLVLASDASRIDLRSLVRDHDLPLRMLGIGLPLTMILGTLVALAVFGRLPFWEAAVLAVILAPTDASLGQPVVTNPKVPARIRQTLNIESGLNDGIAMPFLLLAIALAEATETHIGTGYWLQLAGVQILFGVLAGVIVGYLGLKFVEFGRQRGWMSSHFEKISGVALVILAYGLANLVGGNGFIAAFCMGVVVGNASRQPKMDEALHEHLEVETSLLMLLTFLGFGALMLPAALDQTDIMMVVYAVLSLTLVRMVPVAISLIGSKVRPATTLFLGWFGPRGLASILYVFIVLDAEKIMGADLIFSTVMVTVLISIFAHGISAAPGANWYGKRMADEETEKPDAPEHIEVPEMPLRTKTAA
jgi:NhaP-type Na+/H+ or K+/H+ antiporter